MTSPTVIGTAVGQTHDPVFNATVNHDIVFTSGSAGHMVIAILSYEVGVITTFSGWTLLGRGGAFASAEVWYRVMDGTEGTTATAVTSVTTRVTYNTYRLSTYQGVPVLGSWPGGDSIDPPSLTSGFGAVDTLWIAFLVYAAGTSAITGYPSGYTGGIDFSTGSLLSGPGMGSARKATTAATEDPGVFTIGGGQHANTNTIALQGSAVPVAAFDIDRPATLTLDFTDQSTGGPTSWAWTFGDGGTSTVQNPTHVYAATGTYTITLTATNASGSNAISHDFQLTVAPPYVPPSPSNAVIEIYASAVSAARWGVAHWGEDVWADAQWIDVTPQSVDAIVRWGSHSPEAGILTEMEPASWVVDTYDPGRLLDPGNTDSPYVTDLRAGLPIRIRHRGTIVRQGICETIAYQHKDKAGGIRVTDNVSLMARTIAPADTDLADTLRQRARDVIAAAGLSITVEPDPPSGDPALAPRLEDERSVWRHIADAAEQVLHVPFLDNVGTLHFRAWADPYDRARGVDSTELVDLGTLVSTRGLYSVVRAQQTVGDGDALIERRLTPVPRYGPVVYTRSDPTPDADAWADAVLADRSLQTVQWIPGAIYPLTADDVEYLATLQVMERFGVDFPEALPAVDITGIIVGGEFRVVSKKESEAVWSFELELAQTADSPLYTDEDPGEFLLNDPGDGYLYAG